MAGVGKRMCRVFIVNILLIKSVNMFECMEVAESIYEGFIEPFHKNQPTVMVTAGISD